METPDDASDDALALPEAERPHRAPVLHLSRRRRQLLVGLVTLVLFAVAGIALAGGPDGDRVETADRAGKTTTTAKAAKDRRAGAGAATVGGRGTEGTGDRGDRVAGSGSKRSRTADKAGKGSGDKTGDKHGSATRRAGGDKAGEPGATTSSTTSPPGAPRAVVVSPDPLPAFALVSVSPSDPCPAGTSTVSVEVVGVGGTLDGVVVAVRQVPVAGDGAWALDPFSVPVVGAVEGVAWAATAEHLDVFATCSGGPRSVAAPLSLSPVTAQPAIEASWDGTEVQVSVTDCPTAARIELVVGTVAPVPGPDFQPTSTGAMTAGADPGSWSGSAQPTDFDPSSQGLWATAACLSEAGGTPVWHYTVTEVDPP